MFRSLFPKKYDRQNDRHWQQWRYTVLLMVLGSGIGLYLRPDLLLAQTTITLINRGEASYQNETGQTINVLTNDVQVTYTKEVRAGVKVNPLKINDAVTGLLADSNTVQIGHTLSYYFTVTNTSTVPNPIRVPPRVSLLNLEVLGASFYNVTDGGNEIVILYDRNGNGTIDLSLDQDGDGQWDPLAPDGSPTPDLGSEVWTYRSALQDYENIDGVNWSTATVFIPVNGVFQVVVTAEVPTGIRPGQHKQVFLGNPPPLEDLNNDGLFEIEIEELHDLEHLDDGNPHPEDRDVHTVNILAEGGEENSPIFVNGQRESASFLFITFAGDVPTYDLGIDLSLVGELTTGQTGTYQATITNTGANSVDQFVFVPTNFEAVLGENPTVGLISIVDENGVAVDASTASLTQQTDGTWLLQGVTIAPGTKVTFNLTGTVPALEQEYDLVVEVRSPFGIDGVTPVFVDTNPDNNQDQAVTPFLLVVKREPLCDGDVPYFDYEVAAVNSTNDRLSMTWINPNGEDFVYEDLPLSGRVLWPGAVVSPTGEPLDWPGWRLENGEWLQGDEWDWVRPNVQVNLSVNPEATVTVGYPPATPVCSSNPPGVESSEVDLGIELDRLGDLTTGETGTYQATITNNGAGTVNQFVFTPTGFESVLGANPAVSLISVVNASGVAVDASTANLTQQTDGTWLLQGVTIAPGTKVTFNLTGTVPALEQEYDLVVEVRSPFGIDGVTPVFVDTNPDNNQDQAVTPFLLVVKREPLCDGDVPYFDYEVAAVNSTNDRLSMTWINPNGEDFVYEDLPLSGRVLWPGAVVSPTGEPLDWPGWRLENGEWLQGDEWDWVRPNVQVNLSVNPEATVTVGYPPATPVCSSNPPGVESSEVDLGLDILDPGSFTPGSTGGYTITIANNGPGTVGGFLVTPTGFENVVGNNFQLAVLNLRDGTGNPVDLTGSSITVQANDQWLINGVTFAPGSSLQIQVTGTIQPLLSDVIFQVEAIVSSPLQGDGTPDFIDTNPLNDADQEPQQLQVDLAIDLQPTTDLVPGQAGSYGITLGNNGPGQ